MDYWSHPIAEGDRWDLIAYQYYGDAARVEPLFALNVHLPMVELLPPGETIYIPDLPAPAAVEVNDSLPPWKRTS